nr:immunoglobulin light chain junction region [Macaca mulatta]MOV79317.1 immunoglobulin light chain junction region [Macaca mulatta]MOV80104.1 immunoglobulin light chain junction region [Macaca mulatta]MOV80816.1 immunoglobulin light chain junction region [Macaca mulatta]
CQHHNTYPHSF